MTDKINNATQDDFRRLNYYPLHDAVYKNDLESVKKLIDNGCDLNVLNRQFESPLHIAVKTGNIDILNLLVEKGCDVNISEKYAYVTPIHFAVNAINNPELFEVILKTLLAAGLCLNWRAYGSLESPLYRAVSLGKYDIAAILIKYGADPNLRSLFEETPLYHVCLQGHQYLTRLIVHAGAILKNEVWLEDKNCDKYDQVIVSYIRIFKKTVPSLKHLCRVSVREILQDKLFVGVPDLPLPQPLINFLFLSDVY